MKSKKISKGLRTIFIAHFFLYGAANLVGPFLGIFYINELTDVTLTEIGIGSLIYFLTVGAVEPLIGMIEDKIPGLKDETLLIIIGYILRGFIFIFFAGATNVWHLYLFQFAVGLCQAMYNASDRTMFASLIPKNAGATFWGAEDSIVTISAAIGALIGGKCAVLYGFRPVIIATGILTIVAGLIYATVINELKKHKIWKGF